MSVTPPAPAPETEEVYSLRAGLQERAGGFLVPLAATVLAFLIGGLVVLHHRPQPDHRVQGDLRGSRLQLSLRVADGPGHAGVVAGPPADPAGCDPSDPRGSRRGLLVPVRPLQHRRPGPVLGRVHLRPARGDAPRRPQPASPRRPLHPGRHPRRSLLGRHRRLPPRHRRSPRGDHDDHAQLDRVLRGQVAVRARRAVAGRGALAAAFGDHLRLCDALDHLEAVPPFRAPDSDRGAFHLLHRSQPHHARVRGPRGRVQRGGGAVQRHQREEELLPRARDLGRVRWAGRNGRPPRRQARGRPE